MQDGWTVIYLRWIRTISGCLKNLTSQLADQTDATYVTLLNDETKFGPEKTNHLAFNVRDECVSQQRQITIEIGLKQEVNCNDNGTEGYLRVSIYI